MTCRRIHAHPVYVHVHVCTCTCVRGYRMPIFNPYPDCVLMSPLFVFIGKRIKKFQSWLFRLDNVFKLLWSRSKLWETSLVLCWYIADVRVVLYFCQSKTELSTVKPRQMLPYIQFDNLSGCLENTSRVVYSVWMVVQINVVSSRSCWFYASHVTYARIYMYMQMGHT